MDSSPIIFDISSDEETPAFNDLSGGDDDHNWLSEILQKVDRETDDSDDVVVIGEYNPSKPKLPTSRSSELLKNFEDDDCVILDGDPDKPAGDTEEAADDEDDVLVVGETGQVACRDYPHSRHLCLKFQFSTTLHTEHCSLCHCYVCDSLAPCAYWGTGLSSTDHCHATDKQQSWKTMRESLRRDKDGSVTVSKAPSSLQKAVTQLHEAINFEKIIELTTSHTEAHTQVSRPTTVRACSSFGGLPNIISRSRAPHKWYNRRHSMPALGVRNNDMVRRARGSQTDNFSRQFISSDAMMKNSAFMTNQALYGASNNMKNVSGAAAYASNLIPLAAPKEFDSLVQQNAVPDMVNMSSICEPDTSAVASALASLSEAYPQPVYESTNSQNVWQLDNQTTRVSDPTSLDFNFRWVDNVSTQQQSSVDVIHLSGGTNNDERSTVDPQFPGNFQHPYQDDDNYGRWSSGQSTENVASDIGIFSPEPAGLDAGVLGNYFETSWSGSPSFPP
ncbi:RPM1 interacting protein 13 [Linum grandiflorum]